MSKQGCRSGHWQWGWAGWFEQVEQDLVLVALGPAQASLILRECSVNAGHSYRCRARHGQESGKRRVLFLSCLYKPEEMEEV